MPGRTPIPDEINNYNFEALYRKEAHARTRIRYLCMSHVQAGKSFSEIAYMLKVSRETVRMWVKRFTAEGLTGLYEREGRGAKPRLSPQDEPAFQQAVEALQAERAGGRVTGVDQATFHKTDKLICPDNISLLFLPPYAPELNPVENLWAQLRQGWLANRCFEGYDAIVQACCEAWNAYTTRQNAIKKLCSRNWATIQI